LSNHKQDQLSNQTKQNQASSSMYSQNQKILLNNNIKQPSSQNSLYALKSQEKNLTATSTKINPSSTNNYAHLPPTELAKDHQEQIRFQSAAAPEDEDEESYEMEFSEFYHGKSAKNVRLIKQDFTDDGKVIKYFENEKKEIIFPSGVKKETFSDGYQITYFSNKDIKQIYPNGKEVYLFAENQTLQFKFTDGLQVFKFHDGQIEKNFPDGIKHIIYKDGTVKYIYPDQSDETIFPDGTLQKTNVNGVITIDYVDQIRVINRFLLFILCFVFYVL